MKANIILFTLFDFDQNTNNNRDNITKIIDDITVTLSGCSRLELSPGSIRGEAPNLTSVGLNGINAMSFTVKESAIEYDDLSVNSFQTWSNDNDSNSVAYMLHIKDVSGLKFIRVYNDLRQKVLQIKGIDASHLTKGLYFFKNLRFSRL
ncbi:hypothetical protein Q4Q39_03835 [Flavivirga amylovorans]|uniref:Uncharacterized protein n=1 Tax=Flavivirga amylovorans TaxID=870486 RepID=A0ABT8WYV7_9FLAO|nr:hypothetical protein [Flavivirga amylovorans]MDO5986530.1 hypothetical protein [Flavivirga amylovorans]